MAFDGSCHCGAVTFTVDADAPETALSCNCSHCRRKGFLLAFLPADVLPLTPGEDALPDYHLHQNALTHRFCATCGEQPFADCRGPEGSKVHAIKQVRRAGCRER